MKKYLLVIALLLTVSSCGEEGGVVISGSGSSNVYGTAKYGSSTFEAR